MAYLRLLHQTDWWLRCYYRSFWWIQLAGHIQPHTPPLAWHHWQALFYLCPEASSLELRPRRNILQQNFFVLCICATAFKYTHWIVSVSSKNYHEKLRNIVTLPAEAKSLLMIKYKIAILFSAVLSQIAWRPTFYVQERTDWSSYLVLEPSFEALCLCDVSI